MPGVENGWRCCEAPPTHPLQTPGAASSSAAGKGRLQTSSGVRPDRAWPTLGLPTAMADGTKASLLALIWGTSEGSSQPQNVLRGQQGHLPSSPLSPSPSFSPSGCLPGHPQHTCLHLSPPQTELPAQGKGSHVYTRPVTLLVHIRHKSISAARKEVH